MSRTPHSGLVLRPWEDRDAAALITAARRSADLATQFGGADLVDISSAKEFIERCLLFDDHARNWAVVEGDVAVGNVAASAIEFRHKTAWMSYWLDETARGKGYATRALVAVSDWAFGHGLYRLELGHRVNNPASCRVASAAGFAVEGIEREKLRYGSKRYDVETHARLATDPSPVASGGALALVT